MPSQQKLRAENSRLKEELAASTLMVDTLKQELESTKILYEELKESYETAKAKLTKAKESAKKRQDWNDNLAFMNMAYRKFIHDEFGVPPDIDGNQMIGLNSGTLCWYLRPYAHFAPQLLLPGITYIASRQCLLCGQNIPTSNAVGRCNGCARNAYYCSTLCQRTHWPVHKEDHNFDGKGSEYPDFKGFA